MKCFLTLDRNAYLLDGCLQKSSFSERRQSKPGWLLEVLRKKQTFKLTHQHAAKKHYDASTLMMTKGWKCNIDVRAEFLRLERDE